MRLMTQAQQMRRLTIAQALDSPRIGLIARTAPPAAAQIMGDLIQLSAVQLNIGRNLTDLQSTLLIGDLLTDCRFLGFEELAYLLERGLKGAYGANYGKFDRETVYEWIRQYEAGERADALQQHHAALKPAAPTQSMLEAYALGGLRTKSDAVLMEGIRFYLRRPDRPESARKIEAAVRVMSERWRASARKLRNARAAVRRQLSEPDNPLSIYDTTPTLPVDLDELAAGKTDSTPPVL